MKLDFKLNQYTNTTYFNYANTKTQNDDRFQCAELRTRFTQVSRVSTEIVQ